ncbi:MAG: hypothetical protein GY851_05980 [bacterium]|nr:hypothetical protein [bacterium]
MTWTRAKWVGIAITAILVVTLTALSVGEDGAEGPPPTRDNDEARVDSTAVGVNGSMGQYLMVKSCLREGAEIECLAEVPFEWQRPVSEMGEYAKRYAVGSLKDLQSIDGLEVVQESRSACEAVDEERGLAVRAKEFSERLKVHVFREGHEVPGELNLRFTFDRESKILLGKPRGKPRDRLRVFASRLLFC